MTKQPPRVFLCHASADTTAVHALYDRLVADGYDVWLDVESLLPGQDWQREIPRVVRISEFIVVCLSERSINKEGYVQKEIKMALDLADEKPEGTIFVIPARLEDCKVPERLRMYQWVDLFTNDGYGRLLRALSTKAGQTKMNLPSKAGTPAPAAPPSNTQAQPVSPASLRKAIHSAYDLPELEILCSDLGVRYDDLRGGTLETKIQELIAWHDRRQKYDQLVARILEDRPHLAGILLNG